MCVLVAQLCLTLCDPMDCSSPGSSVHEILQAKILEWEAIPFSRGSSSPRNPVWVTYIVGRLFTALWTIDHQVPLSMGILQARILEWVTMPSPGDLSNPGIKPGSPPLQADSCSLSHPGIPWVLGGNSGSFPHTHTKITYPQGSHP